VHKRNRPESAGYCLGGTVLLLARGTLTAGDIPAIRSSKSRGAAAWRFQRLRRSSELIQIKAATHPRSDKCGQRPVARYMYEPVRFDLAGAAMLWPAIAAASISDMAAVVARQFADLAADTGPPTVEPQWATAHTIALELQTGRLRDFSDDRSCQPTLLCTPLALHSAAIADFEPDHSLIAALQHAGVRHLFAADWRSANSDMRYLGIDDYLAHLNIMVDEIGTPVDLIGLCQGGWMALVYAARFPGKVRKLVLAGAPIDVGAAPSPLALLADSTPMEIFRELIRFGDGLMLGRNLMRFWGPDSVDSQSIHQLLQTKTRDDAAARIHLEARFRDWYSWTMDLPGKFFLEVVERLYKSNELATGKFMALGRQVDLASVSAPVFMLAARDDELIAPPQLFALEHLIGTPIHNRRKATAPCRHVGLFMGEHTLKEIWPEIARWLREPHVSVPAPVEAPAA
jgi:poly(3-hydroxybutyrate) depolymerase